MAKKKFKEIREQMQEITKRKPTEQQVADLKKIFSMGAVVDTSICSICGHKAESQDPKDLCAHLHPRTRYQTTGTHFPFDLPPEWVQTPADPTEKKPK